MRELYKMSDEEKRAFPLTLEDNYYSFKDSNELFGFAKINYLENPILSIFILEEKRGNGYGNELFSKVLQKIKEHGIHFLEIEFPLDHFIMARIVSKNGGIEVTRRKGIVKYHLTIL